MPEEGQQQQGMQLDGAATHYRQRLSESEDNCAILAQSLQQANQQVQALMTENARLQAELTNRETEQPELPLSDG